MSIFKCKMCGGTLEINNNESVGTCEYCGTQQTLPKLDDDRKANLYDRANHFRRNNEFDKAMGIYEQILNEDKTDSEAYWSLVLCHYGIEYVEDPSSHKRIPTVNRAQYTSIFNDDNYKSALQYADIMQKTIYENEAKAINEIQKGILEISQKEEPFDVFICYKETDNNGRRTPDSVLANDLYHQLTQEGFKVFFARITLEDKLGSAYEPYIFAALNSSKVMVVMGTKPEYFNAVWVKNEWSRYLALIKNGEKKMLIPAYKDMDPYDLPEEFSHLQAQDMTKLGFMQDLIRGIKKITAVDKPKQTVVKETVVTSTNSSTEPLLKRAYMFLEDGEFDKVDELCENALNIDPENAEIYLIKLMAYARVSKKEQFLNSNQLLEKNDNYIKILKFGNDELVKELKIYNEQSKINYESAQKEIQRKRKKRFRIIIASILVSSLVIVLAIILTVSMMIPAIKYNNAVELMKQGEYKQAIQEFAKLEGYRDSDDKLFECKYIRAVDLMENGSYEQAVLVFTELGEYKDSVSRIDKCNIEIKINLIKNLNEGDVYTFGHYEQDNNLSNGDEDIEWIVLEREDNKFLLLSRYIIDIKKYNDEAEDISWEQSTLRNWLNNEFVNYAFSTEEQEKMIKSDVLSETGNGGEITKDYVLLLSKKEAEDYHGVYTIKIKDNTEYANSKGIVYPLWWLRDGSSSYRCYCVNQNDISDSMYMFMEAGVRPAMWIEVR